LLSDTEMKQAEILRSMFRCGLTLRCCVWEHQPAYERHLPYSAGRDGD
jgi:hypothetical protein